MSTLYFFRRKKELLTLTRKKYEIEEPIRLEDENGNLLYEFTMQITAEEKNRIRDLIFSQEDVKDGRELSRLEREGKIDEMNNLEEKVLERAKIRQEEFENICFKEYKETFKEKAGAKYEEMVEMLFDFFVKAFADKRASQINTISSHLRKITNK